MRKKSFFVSIFSLLAVAWTPKTHLQIALEAAELAPPDLQGQIEYRLSYYKEGVLEPFRSDPPTYHYYTGTEGKAHSSLIRETTASIEFIKTLTPFNHVIKSMGRAVHFLSDLGNPLGCSNRDPYENRYYKNYMLYIQFSLPKIRRVFYLTEPIVDKNDKLYILIDSALKNCKELYGFISREYRRIGFGDGRKLFDDRSTAFGIASISYNRAVTRAAILLRYIWLSAGGRDQRGGVWKKKYGGEDGG